VRRFRHSKVRSSQIECQLVDATRYDFPTDKLVIYLFNPFSAKLMAKVLRRLDDSVEQHPREIVLVYVYPESGFLLNTMRHFQKYHETPQYCISKSQPRLVA
jgi:hypothetical protein